MAETNEKLTGLFLGLGLVIIFPTMFYEPKYVLPAMIVGSLVMVVPILFLDTIIRVIMSGYMHLTMIDQDPWYDGTNFHLYFDDYTETFLDGINRVELFLIKNHPFIHPKRGKVWCVQIRMKGAFNSRVHLRGGWAAAFSTIFRNGQTDRVVVKEELYAEPEFDKFNGVMPVYRLITGGRDGDELIDIIDKYYQPKTEAELQKETENSMPDKIEKILKSEVLPQ
jgi:hypothetical protein